MNETVDRLGDRGLSSATANHQNNFNFLRLLFATIVIISHSILFIDGDNHREPLDQFFQTGFALGQLAVLGFFLLSGFLIVKSWTSQPQLWPFLKKRILRIYPGFIVASILSEYIFGPLGGNPHYWDTYSTWIVLRRLITLGLPGEPDAFPALHYTLVNESLWSVRYEFVCYIVAAFIGCLGLYRRRYLILGLLALVSILSTIQCTTGSTLVPYWQGKLSELIGPSIRPLAMFLTGACYYLFADKIQYTRRGVLICIFATYPCMFHYTTGQVALQIFGSYVLFASAFMKSPFMQSFGRRSDISYGVYLYAFPIGQLILNSNRSIDAYLLILLTCLSSFVIGWLSWHLVEKPFLRLKPKPSPAQARIADEGLILAEQADSIRA